MRYHIYYNPTAGRGKTRNALPLVEYQLKRKNVDYQINEGGAVCPNETLLRALEPEDVLVAFGGDGTVNRLIPLLIKKEFPLGIIPAGMINNVARAAGISRRIPEAVQTLLNACSKTIDVGRLNGENYFINGVGVGFDGQVILEGQEIQSITGQKVHIVAVAKALKNYSSVKVQVELNNRLVDTEVFQIAIGNSPLMGGGFRLTPEALMDDGALDIALVAPLKKGRIARNLRKLRKGELNDFSEIHLDRTEHITVRSDQPLPVQYDGEVYLSGGQQIEVDVIPAALKLIGDW